MLITNPFLHIEHSQIVRELNTSRKLKDAFARLEEIHTLISLDKEGDRILAGLRSREPKVLQLISNEYSSQYLTALGHKENK